MNRKVKILSLIALIVISSSVSAQQASAPVNPATGYKNDCSTAKENIRTENKIIDK